MSTLGSLGEYLLAYTTPKGAKLCRLGIVLITVPIFPPNFTITWNVAPYFGAYCNIWLWHRLSPAIVPNTLLFTSHHRGMVMTSGLIAVLGVAEPHELWLEVKETEPINTTITNVSPLNQYLETLDFFLIIDTESDYKALMDVVRNWGSVGELYKQLAETNRLLTALVASTPGAAQRLLPQPPIRGGR